MLSNNAIDELHHSTRHSISIWKPGSPDWGSWQAVRAVTAPPLSVAYHIQAEPASSVWRLTSGGSAVAGGCASALRARPLRLLPPSASPSIAMRHSACLLVFALFQTGLHCHRDYLKRSLAVAVLIRRQTCNSRRNTHTISVGQTGTIGRLQWGGSMRESRKSLLIAIKLRNCQTAALPCAIVLSVLRDISRSFADSTADTLSELGTGSSLAPSKQ